MKTNNKANVKKIVTLTAEKTEQEKQIEKAAKAAAAAARKLEKEQKSKEFAARKLERATERFEALKNNTKAHKGIANITIAAVKEERANIATIDGLVACYIAAIKQAAKRAQLPQQVVGYLKKEGAQYLKDNVNNEQLPLYIDNNGNYKEFAAIRVVANKAHNEQLRAILKNIAKDSK